MHTLNLEIDYAHEHSGWIICNLTIDGERHPLDASNVFSPFLPLLHFVKAVAGQRLPHKFFWDEEGYGADFEAMPVAEDSSLVHLKISHGVNVAPWIDADIKRDVVIQAFLPPLIDMVNNFSMVERGWELPRFAVDNVQRAIANGTLLQFSPQRLEYRIHGSYDYGLIEELRWEIWVEDEFKQFFDWWDTSPFWSQWIEFLEKISSGDLPAQLEFPEKLRGGLLTRFVPSIEDLGIFRITYMQAEPLEDLQNFRLHIRSTNWQGEGNHLVLDEVINRDQCVRGFSDIFRHFLKNEYRVQPDRNGKTFDLRTLSIENLS